VSKDKWGRGMGVGVRREGTTKYSVGGCGKGKCRRGGERGGRMAGMEKQRDSQLGTTIWG